MYIFSKQLMQVTCSSCFNIYATSTCLSRW